MPIFHPTPLAIAALILLSTIVATATAGIPDTIRMDPEARTIIQRMKRVHGGEANLNNMISVRVEGSITTADQTYDFVQIKKRPKYQRLTLNRNRVEITFGYDGEDVWRRGPDTPPDQPDILAPDSLPGFVRDASILNHVFLDDVRVEFLGRTNELGFACLRLRCTLPSGEQLEYLIDAQTYLGVRLKPLNLPDDETVVTMYSDYRSVDGIQIPFSFSTIRNGVVESEVDVRRVTFNIGVYDSFFQIPGKVYTIEEKEKDKKAEN
jgi:hypothetical protein